MTSDPHDDGKLATVAEGHDDIDGVTLEWLVDGLEAVSPSRELRARLFDRMRTRDRWLPFVDRLMTLFDLSETATRAALARLEQRDVWESLEEGCSYCHVAVGPAVGAAHAGFVKLQPGGVFPLHRHLDDEHSLVLQGVFEDDRGQRFRAGDVIVGAAGTSHALRTVGAEEVLYASIAGPIEFASGVRLSDPDGHEP